MKAPLDALKAGLLYKPSVARLYFTLPTVAVVDGFAIRVYIVENGERPHVHVIKGGREYRVLLLNDGAQLMTMGGREKTTQAEARRAVRIVENNLIACWAEWITWLEQNLQ